jgi:hypothetical protein
MTSIEASDSFIMIGEQARQTKAGKNEKKGCINKSKG